MFKTTPDHYCDDGEHNARQLVSAALTMRLNPQGARALSAVQGKLSSGEHAGLAYDAASLAQYLNAAKRAAMTEFQSSKD